MNKLSTIYLNEFEVFLNYGAYANDAVLNELYLPILGMPAVGLYKYLYGQAELNKFTSMGLKDHKKMCSLLNMTYDQFVKERRKLEAIGLVRTYSKEMIDGRRLTYLVEGTLNYSDFVNNPQLNELLKKSMDEMSYRQLVYKFNNFVVRPDFYNESVSLDWLLSDKKVDVAQTLNLTDLYTRIINELHLNVLISEESKAQILSYYKNYNLTNNDVYNCVRNSVILSDDKKSYSVSYDILMTNLEKMKHFSQQQDVTIVSKINRNFEIFAYNANIENFKYVTNDYKMINSENYILSITKENISLEMNKTLNKLRTKFHIADPLINVIIDYSLFHNAGRLVPKYIEKIAKSINNLGIVEMEKIIVYLQCVSNNKKPKADIFSAKVDTTLATSNLNNSKKATKTRKSKSKTSKSVSSENASANTTNELTNSQNQLELSLDLDPWGEI